MPLLKASIDSNKYKKVYRYPFIDSRIKEILVERQRLIDSGRRLFSDPKEFEQELQLLGLGNLVRSDDPLGAVLGFVKDDADPTKIQSIGVHFEEASEDPVFFSKYF